MATKLCKTVRVVGGGHSPSDIACTDGYMISLKNMKAVLEVRVDLRVLLYYLFIRSLQSYLDAHVYYVT